MERCKRILHALLYPHAAILITLVPIAIALLIYSFVFPQSGASADLVAYVLSAYTLTVLCVRMPRIVRVVKDENKYVVRWKNDPHLRVNLSLYGSLAFNTVYAVFQLGLGFYHASVWFYALSAYYVLLAVMRFSLLRYTRAHVPAEDMKTELSRYRLCGIVLAVMHLVLGVIVFFITRQGRTFRHHQITTIAIAAYTFTVFVAAIVGNVRYRKYNSPVFSATKAVGLAAALVSMLTLESTMLTAFGGEGEEGFRRVMTGITGIVVVLSVLCMAILMIVKATKELKKMDLNKTQIKS